MSGFGLMFCIGIPFSNITLMAPFIILGVGLDDTFIITGAYFHRIREEKERQDEEYREVPKMEKESHQQHDSYSSKSKKCSRNSELDNSSTKNDSKSQNDKETNKDTDFLLVAASSEKSSTCPSSPQSGDNTEQRQERTFEEVYDHDAIVERVRATLNEVGMSISMTTMTTATAFVLGCISTIPGIRWLCLCKCLVVLS